MFHSPSSSHAPVSVRSLTPSLLCPLPSPSLVAAFFLLFVGLSGACTRRRRHYKVPAANLRTSIKIHTNVLLVPVLHHLFLFPIPGPRRLLRPRLLLLPLRRPRRPPPPSMRTGALYGWGHNCIPARSTTTLLLLLLLLSLPHLLHLLHDASPPASPYLVRFLSRPRRRVHRRSAAAFNVLSRTTRSTDCSDSVLTDYSDSWRLRQARHHHAGSPQIRRLEFRRPLTVSNLSERRVHAPYGLAGAATRASEAATFSCAPSDAA